MNNNFTFNYQKQLEEEEQKEIIRKKAAENQKVIKEEIKEPKKKNNRKYIIYIALAVVLVIYALLSSSSYSSYDSANNNQNTTNNNNTNNNTSNQEEENTINKDIFALLSENNYTYSNKIEITKEEKKEEYLYKGEKKDTVLSIIKSINNEEKEYTYQEEKYFYQENEVSEEEIYDVVNKQYIDLNYISDYVDHASLYATTIYKTGEIVKVYHLPLKEIIIGYQEEDYITIEIDQKDAENYMIHIDYTNIVSLLDEEIISYLVDMEYHITKEETTTP